MKNNIVLVTTTFSPNVEDMRAQLALKTCKAARECGLPIHVIDGSPSQEFKTALRDHGAFVVDEDVAGVEPARRMGMSRQQTIQSGLTTPANVIIWLEPEKHPIVSLLDPCIKPVADFRAEAVIPSRKTFTNYPAYQAESETRGNLAMAQITGHALDYYIGPRVLSRIAAEEMAAYDGRIDGEIVYGHKWEILFVPLVTFFHRGWIVEGVEVDYIHPIEQLKEDDEAMRKKRDEQRECLVDAMTREAKRLRLVVA